MASTAIKAARIAEAKRRLTEMLAAEGYGPLPTARSKDAETLAVLEYIADVLEGLTAPLDTGEEAVPVEQAKAKPKTRAKAKAKKAPAK